MSSCLRYILQTSRVSPTGQINRNLELESGMRLNNQQPISHHQRMDTSELNEDILNRRGLAAGAMRTRFAVLHFVQRNTCELHRR